MEHLAIHLYVTMAKIHYVIESTVKWKAYVQEMVIKEATPTVIMCIKGLILASIPQVGEEWVKHGVVQLVEDGAEGGLVPVQVPIKLWARAGQCLHEWSVSQTLLLAISPLGYWCYILRLPHCFELIRATTMMLLQTASLTVL